MHEACFHLGCKDWCLKVKRSTLVIISCEASSILKRKNQEGEISFFWPHHSSGGGWLEGWNEASWGTWNLRRWKKASSLAQQIASPWRATSLEGQMLERSQIRATIHQKKANKITPSSQDYKLWTTKITKQRKLLARKSMNCELQNHQNHQTKTLLACKNINCKWQNQQIKILTAYKSINSEPQNKKSKYALVNYAKTWSHWKL